MKIVITLDDIDPSSTDDTDSTGLTEDAYTQLVDAIINTGIAGTIEIRTAS